MLKSAYGAIPGPYYPPFENTWKVVLYSLAQSTSWASIHSWFQKARIRKEGKSITLKAPTRFQAYYIRTHFEVSLEPLVRKFYGPEFRLYVEAA